MPTSSSAAISLSAIASAASSSTVTFTDAWRCMKPARHSGTKPMLNVCVAPMRTTPLSSPAARFKSLTPWSTSFSALAA